MTNTVNINIMAPLVVGDPWAPDSEASRRAFEQFDEQLALVKSLGVNAVSTDVWWGLVEKVERQYDWSYYDRLCHSIIKAGLKWVPIISLHQCGGNVGDDALVPLPCWIWTKLKARVPSGDVNAVKYVSEQGNASSEYVSCWATDLVMEDYKALFAEFQRHYWNQAAHIDEINVSLGPAGELRYSSYNCHDRDADYPTRGALQCYSELARQSFVEYVLGKYGSWDGARSAWGVLEKIEPPVDATAFFQQGLHTTTQYGKDLFDWYQQSLLSHGRKVMTAALMTFSSEGAAFAGIDLGAKIPGVHWRMGHWQDGRIVFSDRLAELAAGMIRTSDGEWESAQSGYGYRHIVSLFHDLKTVCSSTRVALHFTCLEMGDGENESLAFQLVRWVAAEAARQGVVIKGESALAGSLNKQSSWIRMRMALGIPGDNGLYQGLTLLRLADVVTCSVALSQLTETIRLSNSDVVVPLAAVADGRDAA